MDKNTVLSICMTYAEVDFIKWLISNFLPKKLNSQKHWGVCSQYWSRVCIVVHSDVFETLDELLHSNMSPYPNKRLIFLWIQLFSVFFGKTFEIYFIVKRWLWVKPCVRVIYSTKYGYLSSIDWFIRIRSD